MGLARENREARDRDFLNECRRQFAIAIERGEPTDARSIIRRVAVSGAPRYYITYERALRNVGPLFRGQKRADRRRRSSMMAQELLEKCREEMEKIGPVRLKFGEALARVLNKGEASSFFISPNYAYQLYYQILEERSRKRRLRHRRLL